MGELMGGGPVTTHWDLTQDMSDEAWHRMIGVHLDGTFFCTREALRLMARKNRGAIINMSSVAALMGLEAAVALQRGQGRHPGLHPRGLARGGLARDPGERDLPGLHRHADDPAHVAALAAR